VSLADERMSVEHQWNDSDGGKLKYWEKNQSQCHFVHHRSHMDCLGTELGLQCEKLVNNV